MHEHQLSNWQHPHNFARINRRGETRTKWVLLLTFFTMLAEISAGFAYHSLALLADGWHMATHVLAFIITIFAFRYSRIHEQDQTFAFSPAKVSFLGGFASAIVLAMVAIIMIGESTLRLLAPEQISFDEAILVACIGLGVNLLSALLLKDHHDQHAHPHHDHHHAAHNHCQHTHHHEVAHDHNLRAAFLHVLADALTSLLAIAALLAGKFYGWNWLDAVMGYVGAAVILVWASGLIRETSPALLDQSVAAAYQQAIMDALEADNECRVTDLHIWRIGAQHQAVIVAIVTQFPKSPGYYKAKLANFVQLDHITVEVNTCVGDECLAE